MSTQLSVTIDKKASGGTFTNYDIIEGIVELQVTRDTKLKSIDVVLEGVSKCCVSFKEGSGLSNHNRDVINKHRQVFQSLAVFPPPPERNQLATQEFTLEVGTYKYPFSFQLPMENDCPNESVPLFKDDAPDYYNRVQDHGKPTFKGAFNSWKWSSKSSGQSPAHVTNQLPPSLYMGEEASIKYGVRATIESSRSITGNVTVYEPIVFLPLDLDGPEEDSPKYEVSVRESFLCARMVHTPGIPLHFFFELRLRDPPIFTPGQNQGYTMHIGARNQFVNQTVTAMPTIYLNRIKTTLFCITEMRAIDDRLTRTLHKTQKVEELVLLDKDLGRYSISLKNMEQNKDNDIYSLEIPSECYSHSIPSNLAPTFETCNLSRSYRLEVVVTYSFDPLARKGFLHQLQLGGIKKVKLKGEGVRIVSGVYLNQNSATHSAPLFDSLDPACEEFEDGLPTYDELQKPTLDVKRLVRREYLQEKEYYYDTA